MFVQWRAQYFLVSPKPGGIDVCSDEMMRQLILWMRGGKWIFKRGLIDHVVPLPAPYLFCTTSAIDVMASLLKARPLGGVHKERVRPTVKYR